MFSFSFFYPLYVGAKPLELFLYLFVAPVKVVYARYLRLAFGDEPREYQGRAGPEIGCHERSSAKAPHALYDGAPAVDADVRAHALEFADMHEPVLEDSLPYDGQAAGNRPHGHYLGLHVGREARVRFGLYVPAPYRQVAYYAHPAVLFRHRSPGLAKLDVERVEVLVGAVFYEHIAAGHGGGDHEGACFYPVGYHTDGDGRELPDALYPYGVGPGAPYPGAHGIQCVGEADDLRFERGGLKYGFPVGVDGGEQHALG